LGNDWEPSKIKEILMVFFWEVSGKFPIAGRAKKPENENGLGKRLGTLKNQRYFDGL